MLKNQIKYFVSTGIYNTILLLITGSAMQTFLIEYGINSSTISVYLSSMQVIQCVTMLLSGRLIDKTKHVIKYYALSISPMILMYSVLMFLGFNPQINKTIAFSLVCIFSVIVNISLGIRNSTSGKIPYHVADMKHFGKFSGTTGTVIGITGTLFSLVMSYVISKNPYFPTIAYFNLSAIVLCVVSVVIALNIKSVLHINIRDNENINVSKINIFLYRPFYMLVIPRALSGLFFGIVSMGVTIGYSFGLLDATSSTVLVFIQQLATIMGCVIFSVIAGRLKSSKMMLFAGIICFILCPLVLVFKTTVSFVLIYLLVYTIAIMITYIGSLIPTQIAEYEHMGTYSSWYTATFTISCALSGALVPFLLKHIGGIATLSVCGLCMLISGIGYYLYVERNT